MTMVGPIVLFVSLYALFLCSVVDGFTPALTFRKSSRPSSLSASVSKSTNDGASKVSFDILPGKHVLVVGGSGRVGGSVVTQLVKRGCKVTVGGTSDENFQTAQNRWQSLFPEHASELAQNVDFCVLNREEAAGVQTVLSGQSYEYDLVVHTAGPFQGKVTASNGVLDAAVSLSIPYIDVCDDYCTASAAKTKFAAKAIETNTPCIISTGCWPGVSSLMAKQLVTKTLSQYPQLTPADLDCKFSFFTAGSGGAGATLLVATFLILSEQALTIQKGRRREVQAMKEYSTANFGAVIGDRDVAHLNLLETASIHDTLDVGSVTSLFGTAPNFWNALLGLMAQLPPDILANEDLMRKLSIFSLPIVRVVDYFAGASNAMVCDITSDKVPELKASAIYAHDNLEPCVGECVVAFGCAVLSGAVPPGVMFPEEAVGGADVAAVLGLASVGAHTVQVKGTNLELSQEEVWGNLSAKQEAVRVVS
jgi:saccharopine dehydrogenase-like NADP-dependent oxidoreductase